MHSPSGTAHLILIVSPLYAYRGLWWCQLIEPLAVNIVFIVYIKISRYLRSGQIAAERWNQASGGLLYLL